MRLRYQIFGTLMSGMTNQEAFFSCARKRADLLCRDGEKAFGESGGLVRQEIFVENLVSGDIILNDEGKETLFQRKLDLILYYFKKFEFAEKRILFNSLSTPLFIFIGLSGAGKKDMLFWQEAIGDEIPGSMQWILNGGSDRIEKIVVQRKDTYDKLLGLGAEKEMLYQLGYIYLFRKENQNKSEALIYTRFDKIEHCRELVEAFPQMYFHITAPTAM